MASFYTNIANDEDMLHTTYSQSQKFPSYPSLELELPDHKAYVRQPSVSVSDLNLLSVGSTLAHDHVDIESIRSRDDAMFISPAGVPMNMQHINMQLNFISPFPEGDSAVAGTRVFSEELMHSNSSEQRSHNHGLCLSLGSQEQSFVQFSSSLSGSLLGSHVVQSEDQISQDFGLKNVEYLSFDLSGGTQDTVKHDVVYDFQNLICSKETDSFPSLHQTSELSGTFCNSRYLKAAQDLLDEVVSVHRLLTQSEKAENKNFLSQYSSMLTGGKRIGDSSEIHASTHDLSPTDLQDMHNKMIKLLSMLDEVDSTYKRYFHQMQAVISSFDAVAGHGAAKRYSALALQRISCQFRALRDAIKKQVQDIQKILGDQDVNSLGHGVVLPRLRYVDLKLRRQKFVQQFGMMRQPWRPQRGLPENAVSVLRAWLFEHFLHPYPKEAEKIVLAKLAGLTRSQVANWFINARVRLWKPMIEDIYKEEFGDTETELKQSPEHVALTQEISCFDGGEEEFQAKLVTAAADSNHWMHSIEPRSAFSDAEVDACRTDSSYDAGVFQNSEVICGLTQVSLALRLQCSEKDLQPISDGVPQLSNIASSSIEPHKLEYYDVETINDQPGVSNPNPLSSDYVA